MTKRCRFYMWSVDDSAFSKLRRRITSDFYTEDTGQGFHLLRATPHEIEGRFVQRITYADEIVSPDGSVSTTERVGYLHTTFRMRRKEGLLLLDPPRSASAFLHRLSHLLDYDVAVQTANPNLIKLKRSLQRKLGKVRVTSVKITGAALAENAMADITVVDPQDALESALALFPRHRSCIGKMDLSFGDALVANIRISAGRKGFINMSTDRSQIVDVVWEAVVEANE